MFNKKLNKFWVKVISVRVTLVLQHPHLKIMFQILILGNVVVSAMIIKLDQARKCKNKTETNHEISVKHVGLLRVCGTAYKFALHALIDAEICSTATVTAI